MSEQMYNLQPTLAAVFDFCTRESVYVNNKYRNGFLTPTDLRIDNKTQVIIISEIHRESKKQDTKLLSISSPNLIDF